MISVRDMYGEVRASLRVSVCLLWNAGQHVSAWPRRCAPPRARATLWTVAHQAPLTMGFSR